MAFTSVILAGFILCCAYGAPLADEISQNITSGDTTGDYRVEVEYNRTAIISPFAVRHLAPDLYRGEDFMLAAWGNALITTRIGFPEVYFLAGSVDSAGYLEGTGTQARFKEISSFLQLDKNRVAIVDRQNSCIRMLNRETGVTTPFVGRCGVRGWPDGKALEAAFNFPNDILFDERNHDNLIILDDYNDAIRLLDTKTMMLKTLYANDTDLYRPRYAIVDENNPDILYVTIMRRLVKYSFEKNAITILTGAVPSDDQKFIAYDGHLDSARFGYMLSGIAQINAQFLVISDYWNDKVRIIDLHNEQVYSLCEDDLVQVFGVAMYEQTHTCRYVRPHAVTILDNNLYIGENGRIVIKTISILEGARKPVIGSSVTRNMMSVCNKTSISATIGVNKTSTEIILDDGNTLELQQGEYNYTYTNQEGAICRVRISVTHALDTSQCVDVIARVASPETDTAQVDLTFRGVTQVLELPIGQHPYYLKTGNHVCNMTINVYDSSLQRTLNFKSLYNFDCSRLDDKEALSLTKRTAQHNAIYINEICGGVCSVSDPDKSVHMECSNDTLTVTYQTDLVFGGDMLTIPVRLEERLVQSLVNKGLMMSLVDIQRIPPIIEPEMTAEGAAARLVLLSSCSDGKKYKQSTDSCTDI